MNAYEILLLLDPDLPEERQEEIVVRTREVVERAGGTWDGHEPWGRRKLAYEIQHKGDGTYHLLQLSCEPATLDEISRVLKITDGVLRHMATRRVEPRPKESLASEAGSRQDEAEPVTVSAEEE